MATYFPLADIHVGDRPQPILVSIGPLQAKQPVSGEREKFTSSPTFLCGNTPATLG